MKTIKLQIQKREDIVFLLQGLNYIRLHNILETKKELDLNHDSFNSIEERAKINDRLMSIIAQLDKILEE